MPLISRIPEYCKEHDMGPTDLHNAVLKTGVRFSYNNAHALYHGKTRPGMIVAEKICDAFGIQLNVIVVHVPAE